MQPAGATEALQKGKTGLLACISLTLDEVDSVGPDLSGGFVGLCFKC